MAAASNWPNLASVEKIDDLTVAITLTEPYGPALYNFSGTYIIPDEAFAAKGTDMFTNQELEGSGPWQF